MGTTRYREEAHTLMRWHIVADTSCDLFSLPVETPDADFSTIPFSIRVGGTEYIDNEDISIETMLMANETTGKPRTRRAPDLRTGWRNSRLKARCWLLLFPAIYPAATTARVQPGI